jgi:hypothetical protein
MLSHSPYSPDLVPSDFFLFPKLKIALKGKIFKAVSWIEQTARELKEICECYALYVGCRAGTILNKHLSFLHSLYILPQISF